MPVAELILDNPTKEFERFYIKVKDQHTNLVIYSASIEESPRLLKEVGDLPGLYILQAEDSTLYVGQSKALGSRLKTHRASRKIGFNRILAVVRDQSLALYLDYAEAKIYDELEKRGFRLDQAPLSGSLDTKRRRLVAQDNEHVRTADIHVHQFLNYAVALGLVKPVTLVNPQAAADVGQTPITPLATQAPLPATTDIGVARPLAVASGPAPATPTKRKSVKLVVRDAQGKPFEGVTTADVFVAVLRSFGLSKIANLNLSPGGIPLVALEQPVKYAGQARLVDGYWVSTHSSNERKVRVLRQVAEMLGSGLDIVQA